MAARKSTKKRIRKAAKLYTFATFETEIFEGEFSLPLLKQMPIGTAARFSKGDFAALTDWLDDAGVPAEDIDAIQSLDNEEFELFVEAWNSGVLGK